MDNLKENWGMILVLMAVAYWVGWVSIKLWTN